jgi:hypothetical protein
MRNTEQVYDQRSAACPQDRSIFVGLEVSRSSWLVAISMPGNQKRVLDASPVCRGRKIMTGFPTGVTKLVPG